MIVMRKTSYFTMVPYIYLINIYSSLFIACQKVVRLVASMEINIETQKDSSYIVHND